MVQFTSKSTTQLLADKIAGYVLLDRAFERMDSNRAVREPGSILLDCRSKIAVELAYSELMLAMAIADNLRSEFGQ